MIFLIPGDQTKSGRPEVATHKVRMLVATTPEETHEVPESWIVLDVDQVDTITVTQWIGVLRDGER